LAQRIYEALFLLDPVRYAHDPVGISGVVNRLIESAGGEILVSRLWDERRLAYPIRGHRKGVYWLTYFRLDGSKLGELKRQCYLDSNILRVMILRIDPRIADTLVEHARSGQPAWRKVEPEAIPVPSDLDEEEGLGPEFEDEEVEEFPALEEEMD
jgi:small subunit ribosomal protein S6